MLLITTFVELRVVARRCRLWAGCPHAVSGRPIILHTCHAMPMPCCAMAVRSRFQNSMVVAWHRRGMGMACVNQTRPHCVNQMGKTQSKPFVAGERQGNSMVCVNPPLGERRCRSLRKTAVKRGSVDYVSRLRVQLGTCTDQSSYPKINSNQQLIPSPQLHRFRDLLPEGIHSFV
jgi:hypothetical protein